MQNKQNKFFRFPKTTDSLREKWISTIESVYNCSLIVKNNSTVCSCHFPDNAYQNKNSTERTDRLKVGTIPSMFVLPGNEVLVFTEKMSTDKLNHGDSSPDIFSPIKKRKLPDLKLLSESEIMAMNQKKLQQTLKRTVIAFKECSDAKKKIYDKMVYYKKKAESTNSNQHEPELIELILKGKDKNVFHPKVVDFAKHSKYISEKGYNHLRDSLGKHRLPCVRTIRSWLSHNNGAPGVTTQNLDLLATELSAHPNLEPALALIMDEMNIRSKLRYVPCEDKIYGYVDFGDGVTTSIDPENVIQNSEFQNGKINEKIATNALFFLVNGINIKLKLPIGYVLIEKLTGSQKADLLKQIIKLIYVRGKGMIKVVTLDGDPAHLAMAEELGATFKIDDVKDGKVKATIRIEGLDWDIQIMLDINHMLKLIRNNQEARSTLYIGCKLTTIFSETQLKELLGQYFNENIVKKLENDSDDERKVDWNYLQQLHEYQERTGIRLNNKITRHHINFRAKIMNVRLCAQTLHDDTGDSFLCCQYDLELKEFKGSVYTAIAFKIYHRIFLIFNSMYDDSVGWKSPISKENLDEVLRFLDSAEVFIRSLNLANKKPVVQSKIKTGFIGIIVGIDVLKNLVAEYIQTGKWEKVMMYPTSQDHIEIFFGFIRLRLGCNDNPDSYILECVYKSILGLKAMYVTGNGNCEMRIDDCHLNTSSSRVKISNIGIKVNESWKLNKSKEKAPGRTRKATATSLSAEDTERFTQSAISWNSLVIQRQIEDELDCSECVQNLQNDKIKAHPDVIEICRKSEFIIDLHLIRMSDKFNSAQIKMKILSMMRSDVMSDVCDHSHTNEDVLDEYRHQMIKKIIQAYIEMRSREKFQRISDNLHGEILRHRNKKLTLFMNQ
jgi:Transposase protein/THAP domain